MFGPPAAHVGQGKVSNLAG